MSNIDLIGLSNGVNIMLRVGQIDVNQGRLTVADPECARGGAVSHILAEKRGVSFTFFKSRMCKRRGRKPHFG